MADFAFGTTVEGGALTIRTFLAHRTNGRPNGSSYPSRIRRYVESGGACEDEGDFIDDLLRGNRSHRLNDHYETFLGTTEGWEP